MAPSQTSAKAKGKGREKPKEAKDKAFHPQSRKASQIERAQLRKAKLATAASKKNKREAAKVDRFVFFYHAIPPESPAVTLAQLHDIIRDIWLKRHDTELEAEKTARRLGRPKSTRQMQLEELKLRESEEYRTGLEVPDITHPPTVKLFRQWGQTGVGFLDLLRFIRINSENPSSPVVSRPGKHRSLTETHDVDMEETSEGNGDILREPPVRFASTMQTMDTGPAARPAD